MRSGRALTGSNNGASKGARGLLRGVRLSYPTMSQTQESTPRRRSAFAAAFLSLIFPGLGHAYAGAYTRALGFAAGPILLIALGAGVGLRVSPAVLVGYALEYLDLIQVLNVLILLYRIAAAIDAYRVVGYLNGLETSGGGRLGRARRAIDPISVAGLAAVVLVMAGVHVAVARYDSILQGFVSCTFDPGGTAVCEATPDASPSPGETDTPIGGSPGPSSDLGTPVPGATPAPAGAVVAVSDGAPWAQAFVDYHRPDAVRIRDVLAVDTFVPQRITGGLAGEFALENAVALAAMVRTSKGPMELLAAQLREALGVEVLIAGVEADMAVLGALTTPGTDRPVAIVDLGGGSTDAAVATNGAEVDSVHLAGAGDLVTKLIDSELGLENLELAEEIKKFPLAKAESFFHIRLEDGTVRFFEKPLPADTFARVVVLTDAGLHPIPTRHSVEKIRQVRREAKSRVFVVNALRALEQVAPGGHVRQIGFVVVLGGSALDFEIPDMIADAVAEFGIVSGTGNVRGREGPRNAVATGLVASYAASHAVTTAVGG